MYSLGTDIGYTSIKMVLIDNNNTLIYHRYLLHRGDNINTLKEALEMNLISSKVNVLINFTEHAYYGKREDKMIKGTNWQNSTKKMRHYLGFSILSRGIHLFGGLEQIAIRQLLIPVIIKFLDSVLELGFELN